MFEKALKDLHKKNQLTSLQTVRHFPHVQKFDASLRLCSLFFSFSQLESLKIKNRQIEIKVNSTPIVFTLNKNLLEICITENFW